MHVCVRFGVGWGGIREVQAASVSDNSSWMHPLFLLARCPCDSARSFAPPPPGPCSLLSLAVAFQKISAQDGWLHNLPGVLAPQQPCRESSTPPPPAPTKEDPKDTAQRGRPPHCACPPDAGAVATGRGAKLPSAGKRPAPQDRSCCEASLKGSDLPLSPTSLWY